MAKQTINLGTMADNKSGDPLRTAFTKVNENFTELYDRTIPTDINQLTDEDGLLGQGGANTGDVTFNNVEVTGKALNQVGTQIYISTNYNGDQPGVNGTGVQVPANTQGIDQVGAGWTVTFATGITKTLITAYYWEQDNFWVLQWADSYASGSSVYPLTVQSADFKSAQNAALILKAESVEDAPWSADYGVKVFNSIDNDTHLSPLTRQKGISLGFAYGQGSHVRVEGTDGQWGTQGSGDRVAIYAQSTDGQNTAEWLFDNDGNLYLPDNGDIKNSTGNSVIPSVLSTVDGVPAPQPLGISTNYPVFGIGGNNACFDTNVWTGNGGFGDIQVGDSVSTSNGWNSTITQIGIYGNGWLTAAAAWDNDPAATYYVNGAQQQSNLDLTKKIHKLVEGDYYLPDGEEGQLIYIVPKSTLATPSNVWIQVANARSGSNNFVNGWLGPFRQTLFGNYDDIVDSSLCTLIFTDGAWVQSGGIWD